MTHRVCSEGEALAGHAAGKGEAGGEEQEREGKMASPALSVPSVDAETPAAAPETETHLRACGCVAHLSKLQLPLFNCTVDNNNHVSGIHYCRNNVRLICQRCWTTRMRAASPPVVLWVLTFIEPRASVRQARDVRSLALSGLCRWRCSRWGSLCS